MPTLELSELEIRMLWVMTDLSLARTLHLEGPSYDAAVSAVEKVYRAYRGMPPERAA